MRNWMVLLMLFVFVAPRSYANEVIESTPTQILVREHPQTGISYVSIVSSNPKEVQNPIEAKKKLRYRPNYERLDPKVKPDAIPYDGPTSNRTKVYVFAASLAAVGTVGALAAPAAASTGAATGGAGVYGAAGAAVGLGSISTALTLQKTEIDDNIQKSESHALPIEKGSL